MKKFTAFIASQRYAASQTPVWLLKLTGGASPWFAASRPIVFEGQTYPASLSGWPRWTMGSERRFGVGGLIGSKAEIRVADVAGGSGSLRDLEQETRPVDLTADLKLLWIDDPATWTDADAVTILKGRVTGWKREATAVTLNLQDSVSALAGKNVGRILLPSMIVGESSPLLGETLPLVIGRHDALPLAALRPGIAGRLAESLGVDDPVLTLVSVEGFPPVGSIQVGDEIIGYSTVDSTAMTLGATDKPITRGQEVMLHSVGEPVRSIPAGGFQWLVADHPCKSVADVRSDGTALDPGDWTSELRRLGEEDAQVVTMSRWPVRLRFARTAGRRSATDILGPGVYGVAGANNALNPEQAIDTKLTSTAARLADGTGDLAFTIAAALGSEGTLLGRWGGASLRVRYSATKLWAPGSQLNLAFKQGASTFQASVPRPDPGEAQGQVEAPPGQEGDMVDTSLGIHEFEIDLAGAIAESTGWDALDVSPPTEMRVEFVADVDDDTVVFVHDLQLFVSYFAQLTAEPARTITARVEGWMDEAQEVIENPADVIELLLTDSRFAGLGSGEIDAADLSAFRSELASKGFTYARRIGGGHPLGDLIESAARESAVWIQSGGEKAGLARRGVSPPVAGSPETLDDTKSLDASAPVRIVTPRGEVLSDCFTVVAGGEATGGEPKVWSRCADGSQGEGSIPEETALAWLDGREEGALAQLGGRILSAGREPEVSYTQSYPLGAIVLEPGDSIRADRAVVGLNAMPAWVESARTVSGSRVEIKMRGPEAGEFCWQEDGETFLRVFGFGARVTAYLSGLAMVSVEQGGRFVLRGRFREEANFSAGPFSGAVVHSGGFLYWSLGSGGSFTPFLRIDGAGNVDLNGTLREESALAFLIDGQCLSADAARFRLSPQGSEAALEFTGGVLHLAGRMAEDLEL